MESCSCGVNVVVQWHRWLVRQKYDTQSCISSQQPLASGTLGQACVSSPSSSMLITVSLPPPEKQHLSKLEVDIFRTNFSLQCKTKKFVWGFSGPPCQLPKPAVSQGRTMCRTSINWFFARNCPLPRFSHFVRTGLCGSHLLSWHNSQ